MRLSWQVAYTVHTMSRTHLFFSEFSLMLIACVYIYTQLLRSLESMHNEHETPQDVPLWKFNASLDTLSAPAKHQQKEEWMARCRPNQHQQIAKISTIFKWHQHEKEREFIFCMFAHCILILCKIHKDDAIDFRVALPFAFIILFLFNVLSFYIFSKQTTHTTYLYLCAWASWMHAVIAIF